jgi:hypothetical protein
MLKRFTRKGLYLSAYSPGDGAIDFTWVDPKTNHCVSSHVTPSLIKQFQKHSVGKSLQNHTIHRINGQLRLVHPITRINENTLLIDGKTFTYTITPDPHFTYVRYHDINVETTIDTTPPYTYQVKNASLVQAICFFLNHEPELTPQPTESLITT